jgi:hypothetical protein
MEPFVARSLTPTDPAWQAEVARKQAKTKRRLRKRRWLGWLRSLRRDQTSNREDGFNLIELICRFPGTRFACAGLPERGYAVARAVQQPAQLPEVLQRLAPEPLVDLSGHRIIEFHSGSAAAPSFADASFNDLPGEVWIWSCLVVCRKMESPA